MLRPAWPVELTNTQIYWYGRGHVRTYTAEVSEHAGCTALHGRHSLYAAYVNRASLDRHRSPLENTEAVLVELGKPRMELLHIKPDQQ